MIQFSVLIFNDFGYGTPPKVVSSLQVFFNLKIDFYETEWQVDSKTFCFGYTRNPLNNEHDFKRFGRA